MSSTGDIDVVAAPSPEIKSDGQLLAEVASSGSAACFQRLVERHSAMVLNACQRQLGDAHEAEDAAQAVFLVLWRKAASLKRRTSVAGWLHHVARNVCRNAKRSQQARKMRERQAAMQNQQNASETDPWDDVQELLDEELDQLPEKYRLPIILFHLEGRTQEEVAALLNTKQPTVAKRLKRGREILCSRLARRGVAVAVTALAGALTAHACAAVVPTTFPTATVQAATLFAAGKLTAGGVLSAKTAALAKGALDMLTIAKLKMAAALVVTATVVTGGGVAVVQQVVQKSQPEPAIAWGEPADGLRVGLSPKEVSVTDETKSIEVGVWYENVGDQPRIVPNHRKNRANEALIWFAAQQLGKKYDLRYVVWHDGTSLPGRETLAPGERFEERVRIHFGFPFGRAPEDAAANNEFWGLPDVKPGEPLTLQLVYPAFEKSDLGKTTIETFGKNGLYDSTVERRSGKITVAHVKDAAMPAVDGDR